MIFVAILGMLCLYMFIYMFIIQLIVYVACLNCIRSECSFQKDRCARSTINHFLNDFFPRTLRISQCLIFSECSYSQKTKRNTLHIHCPFSGLIKLWSPGTQQEELTIREKVIDQPAKSNGFMVGTEFVHKLMPIECEDKLQPETARSRMEN